ncbi:MAG: methyltransferase domain-containing protein [Streptosporangiales bacterium]|nr:methyltransferase domain-containing protein [Streptosporangiales bacterium]
MGTAAGPAAAGLAGRPTDAPGARARDAAVRRTAERAAARLQLDRPGHLASGRVAHRSGDRCARSAERPGQAVAAAGGHRSYGLERRRSSRGHDRVLPRAGFRGTRGTLAADRPAATRGRLTTGLTGGGARILEIASGPGYVAIALAKTGSYAVTGLDISKTFVEIARRNAAGAGVSVDFRHGNASAMPFDADSFDFIVCSAAFKNFSRPARALQEMCRVLRPDGTALVVDLRRDVSKRAVDEEVQGMGLGAFSRVFTAWALRAWLPRRAYSRTQFEDLIAQTNFRAFEIRETRLSLEVELRK